MAHSCSYCYFSFIHGWLLISFVVCCAGRVLSVTWSPDARRIYSGSSDGYVHFFSYNLVNMLLNKSLSGNFIQVHKMLGC